MIAKTTKPPYYAVIFTSLRTEGDNDYGKMVDLMVALAQKQDGFIGVESAREELGITVSYWRDMESIKKWKQHTDHKAARVKGRSDWYTKFKVRIAKVESDYGFSR